MSYFSFILDFKTVFTLAIFLRVLPISSVFFNQRIEFFIFKEYNSDCIFFLISTSSFGDLSDNSFINNHFPFIFNNLNKIKYYLISHFVITLVFIGNFFQADVKTFIAKSAGNQLSSRIIFHLLTAAAYISTSHFQVPIGISNPFFVRGTSGNTLNQSCHTFLIFLTTTFLAASNCLFVRYQLVVALSQYSQKDI